MPVSTLIVQLPPRPRSGGRPRAASPESLEQALLTFVLCDAQQHLLRHGTARVDELPEAAQWVAVLDSADIAWHRLETLPRAPVAKLRVALASLLEERLLEDEAELHLALAPQPQAGAPVWVAVTQLAWLQTWLTLLERRGGQVERVVPGASVRPAEEPALAHVTLRAHQAWLCWADAQGVIELPLLSASAQRLWAAAGPEVRWSASPEAVAVATQAAGMPVVAVSDTQRLLGTLSSAWNLRQFGLATRHRTDRWLRAGWQRVFQDPALRPVRWGMLALVLANIVGAGAWAWQQQRALAERKQAMNSLLQTTFPQVRAIIDAPAQMTRALDTLRVNAGQPGETDLETLLAAAHHVWPDGMPPAQALHFEIGQLRIVAPGWTPQRVQQVRPRLWPLGLDAQATADGWTVQPLRGEPDRRDPASGSEAGGASAPRGPAAAASRALMPPPPGRAASAAMGRLPPGRGMPPQPGGMAPPVMPPEEMPEDAVEENADEEA